MGWFTGPWSGVQASYHCGDWSHAHCGMALVPDGNWGVVVLFNVRLHGGALPGLLAIEQSLTGMLAGRRGNTGVGAFYLASGAVAAVILAAQGWLLARLARRDARPPPPLRGFTRALAQGRRWALPLLWEFGIPAAIVLVAIWHGLYNLVAGTQAAAGLPAAVVSTLIMIQAAALIVLEVQARRRGQPRVLGPA
jgi:hypothetical protein